ncbi:uncharacterized protein LOC144009009 isoform X3 [Festucalex cinctus]
MFTLMAKGNASSLTKAKRHLPVVVVHLLLRKHFQFHKLIQHVDEYRDESKRRFPQGGHLEPKMSDLLYVCGFTSKPSYIKCSSCLISVHRYASARQRAPKWPTCCPLRHSCQTFSATSCKSSWRRPVLPCR